MYLSALLRPSEPPLYHLNPPIWQFSTVRAADIMDGGTFEQREALVTEEKALRRLLERDRRRTSLLRRTALFAGLFWEEGREDRRAGGREEGGEEEEEEEEFDREEGSERLGALESSVMASASIDRGLTYTSGAKNWGGGDGHVIRGERVGPEPGSEDGRGRKQDD